MRFIFFVLLENIHCFGIWIKFSSFMNVNILFDLSVHVLFQNSKGGNMLLPLGYIIRSPWSADCGLCQVLQRCCWIPENCGPDQMWIEVDAGVVALCELSGVSSTCDASTSIPANVLASLTTTGESDVSISATTNRNSLETGSLKTRDGTE